MNLDSIGFRSSEEEARMQRGRDIRYHVGLFVENHVQGRLPSSGPEEMTLPLGPSQLASLIGGAIRWESETHGMQASVDPAADRAFCEQTMAAAFGRHGYFIIPLSSGGATYLNISRFPQA